jgi:hypothetical protein
VNRESTQPGASRFTHHASRFIHPLVYEINTRGWLPELATPDGLPVTLATVPDSEFLRWRRFGFTHIWLMGVWTTGPRSCAVSLTAADLQAARSEAQENSGETDLAGSPYAIAEYRVPDALGGEIGLQKFRQKLHDHGMKLLLDFVPNHFGLDHPWLSDQPELFVQSPEEKPGTFTQPARGGRRWLAHGRDPYFAPWADTAQLDYRQPATRTAMLEQLLAVAGRCDGVRCDMAMLVLNEVFEKTWKEFPPAKFVVPPSGGSASGPPEGGTTNLISEFWSDAIQATKRAHPDFLFLAEVYWGMEARLQALGFDYTYDKELYDEIIRHDAADVQRHLLKATPEFIAASAHFLENHDEARIASLLALAEHRAAAFLILALPGMRLLHHGQLTGARLRTPVQFSRRAAEAEQPEIRQLYDELLGALRKTAVGQGQGRVLAAVEAWEGNPTAQNFILIQWQPGPSEFELAAINLAPHRSQCRAFLNVPDLAASNWSIEDLLTMTGRQRAGRELQEQGLYLDLPGNGVQLLSFQTLPDGILLAN